MRTSSQSPFIGVHEDTLYVLRRGGPLDIPPGRLSDAFDLNGNRLDWSPFSFGFSPYRPMGLEILGGDIYVLGGNLQIGRRARWGMAIVSTSGELLR